MTVPRDQWLEARRIWKSAKAKFLKPPLTKENVQSLRGTSYYYLFQELGWIDKYGNPVQP